MNYKKQLYEVYNSRYKTQISSFDNKTIRKYWKWCKSKYLPYIKTYPKDSNILELGCGRGYFLEFLKQHGYINITGIDISEEQIKVASEKNLSVRQADAFEFFSTNENKYDIIIAIDFFEHLTKDELVELLKGIYSNLNDGGMLIAHTPNGQGLMPLQMIYGDLTHSTILTPNSAEQLLRLTGFNEMKFLESGPVAKNIRGVVRVFLWSIIKLGANLIQLIETGGTEKILTRNFICITKKDKLS